MSAFSDTNTLVGVIFLFIAVTDLLAMKFLLPKILAGSSADPKSIVKMNAVIRISIAFFFVSGIVLLVMKPL